MWQYGQFHGLIVTTVLGRAIVLFVRVSPMSATMSSSCRRRPHHETHSHHPQDEYHYSQPVTLGPHRAILRPREGHDVRIVAARMDIEPPATLRWLRDI